MKRWMKNKDLPFAAKLACILISIICLGYLLTLGKVVLAPLFLACLLAMLFEPFARLLEKKLKFSRGLSSLSSVSVVLLFLLGLGYFIGDQVSSFSEDIPQLKDQSVHVFHGLQDWVNDRFTINIEKQFEYLQQGADRLLVSSGMILGFTFTFFSSSLGFFVFFLLFFTFILNYRRILHTFILQVFSDEHRVQVKEVVSEIQRIIKSYVTGVFIQIAIVSTLAFIALTVLGVKYALLLGVLTGLLNVIPYIGISLSLLISCFIAFATSTPITCLYVAIAYIGIHAIDGNIIIPFIVGSKVKINALFSFIGIIVGEQLWGIAGMFLCIPALAIIKIIFERIEHLQPWGTLLGNEVKMRRKKRKVKITPRVTFEEKD